MQELDILYPEMDPGTLQVTVLQRGDELLKEFSDKYRQYAADELRDRGVTLRLGHGVKEVGYDHVVLDDDSILESDITIWAAGVAIPECVSEWGLPQDKRGRLAVDDHLQVKGFPGVYAAGDIASQDEPLPQLAQPAIQTGAAVARSIAADVKGKPRPTFSYTNLGTMATIGRHAAIAEIPFLGGLSGSMGWAAWLGVHITKMLGHRNQRAVAMNLLSLYGGSRATHQPNPVVGEVDSLRAAKVFEEQAPHRLFGLNAGATSPVSPLSPGSADEADGADEAAAAR
jgi:NADH dehydrogenase